MKKRLSKLTIKSYWLIIIATLYFGFVLNLSFWRYAINNVEITGFTTAFFAFTLLFFIIIPLYLIFNLLTLPYITKPVIVTLLLISSATNYFMYTYGVFIDTDMIANAFETNTREAFDLVTFSGTLWFITMGLIPAALLICTKIEYGAFRKELKIRLTATLAALIVLGGVAATTYKEYAAFGRNHREVRKLLNTINYTYSTVRYFQRLSLANREFIKLDPDAKWVPFEDPHVTVLILVLGETARAQNFSLNGYERETNPKLAKQDIIAFDEVLSCGTATAISVPCMFSNVDRKYFDVTNARFTENFLDIAQSAGYNVWWRENDDGCKGVCDRVPHETMLKTKNAAKYCDDKNCFDDILLDGMEDYLKNITQDTIIVLHTIGSHGPTYYKRYPDEFKKFKPTCDTAQIQDCTKEQIINTYDNTILYTDHIVSEAIDILKKFPQFEAGLIYVSDHGESLGEKNIYLHGIPYAIAPDEQTQVPMVLWMSETMKRWDYVDYDCMKKEAKNNTYSHDNLFHSILGLLEIKTKVYSKEYDIFRNCRTKELFNE